MDVQGGRDREGNNVQVYRRNMSPAQKWKVIYQDEAAKIKTEGFAKEYGMKIGQPFYLVTAMTSGRVVTCHGAHHVRLNKPHRDRTQKSQHWIYDNVSKTITNVQWPRRSLTINGNNVITQPTNSRWTQIWKVDA
jgi:hypothetical protein